MGCMPGTLQGGSPPIMGYGAACGAGCGAGCGGGAGASQAQAVSEQLAAQLAMVTQQQQMLMTQMSQMSM
eukprot:scaffold94822_cov19-Phaeocystis_antarctica.AAC.1